MRSIRPSHLTLRLKQQTRKPIRFLLQDSKSTKVWSSDFALDGLFVLQEKAKKEKNKPFKDIFEIEASVFGWTFLVFSGEFWHTASITTLKHIAKSAKLVIIISVPESLRHRNLVNALVLGVDDRNFACAWSIPRMKKGADNEWNAPIKDPYSPLRGIDVLPHEIVDTLVKLQKSDGLHKVRLGVFRPDFLFGPEDGPRLPWKEALLVMKNSADAHEVKQGESILIPALRQLADGDFESVVPVPNFAHSPNLDEPSPESDCQMVYSLPQSDHGLNSEWFGLLEQSVKDAIVTFVTQSTHHYGGEFSPHVIADIKAKFGLEDYQIEQLPLIVYSAQTMHNPASFREVMQVEDDGCEDSLSLGKTNQYEWFESLEQSVKYELVSLAKGSTYYYGGGYSANVISNIKARFRLNDDQIDELPKILYGDNLEAFFQKPTEGKAEFSFQPYGLPSEELYQDAHRETVDENRFNWTKKRKANFQGEPKKKQKTEHYDFLVDDNCEIESSA